MTNSNNSSLISFSRLQYKVNGENDSAKDCVLDCPKKTGNCVNQTCCGPQQDKQGKESPKTSSNGSTPRMNHKKPPKSTSQTDINTTEFVEVVISGDMKREKSRSAEDMV